MPRLTKKRREEIRRNEELEAVELLGLDYEKLTETEKRSINKKVKELRSERKEKYNKLAAPLSKGLSDHEIDALIAQVPPEHRLTARRPMPINKRKNYASERTERNKEAFLIGMRGKFAASHACRAIGISRRVVFYWMQKDEHFAEAVAEAKEMALDDLEESMFERAKTRDTLAGIFLLKGNRPETYHDRSHKVVSGPEGGPIQVASWAQLAQTIDAEAAIAAPQQPIIEGELLETVDAPIDDLQRAHGRPKLK